MIFLLAYLADVAICITYFALARSGKARPFHWANAIGCVPIIVTELVLHAYAPLILTAFFGAVGIVGLTRDKGARMLQADYVAGPMTNRPKFNFDTFDAVAAARRASGRLVFNPHEHDQETYPGIDEAEATRVGDVVAIASEVGFDFHAAMRWDLARVAECDTIVLLPEWETSSGAKAERFVAEMTGSRIVLAEWDAIGAWSFREDPVQKRIAVALIDAA